MPWRRGLGAGLPLSAQQKVAPRATPLLAPEETVRAVVELRGQATAASLVPPGCATLDALKEMRAWKAPPPTIPVGAAVVWAQRLPAAVADGTGRAIAVGVRAKYARNAAAAGLGATRIENGYIPGERIAWVAVRVVSGLAVSQSRLNSFVNGQFQAALLERRLPWLPGVPIYLAPADVPEEAGNLRTQVYIAAAYHSALTWDDFRAAVAVRVFGGASLTANITHRVQTNSSRVALGLRAAQETDATAAQAEQVAQEAIQLAEEYAATGAPDDGPCPGNPQQTCKNIGPRARARVKIEQARRLTNHKIGQVAAANEFVDGLEAQIAEVRSTLGARFTEALEATKNRITEPNALLRQYMECALAKNAAQQMPTVAAGLQAQAERAPVLVAEYRAAAPAALARLQETLQNIDEIEQEAERRAGGSLGPLIPPWAWWAIGVGGVSFIGIALLLRRSRRKRTLTTNRRRRTRRRRRAA